MTKREARERGGPKEEGNSDNQSPFTLKNERKERKERKREEGKKGRREEERT